MVINLWKSLSDHFSNFVSLVIVFMLCVQCVIVLSSGLLLCILRENGVHHLYLRDTCICGKVVKVINSNSRGSGF